ncbi:hypothetical protein ACHAW6_001373, partial [Cyclotella cf. meneghiniana]
FTFLICYSIACAQECLSVLVKIQTGDILDNEMATILLRQLLDLMILHSCHDVFKANDKILMFKDKDSLIRLEEKLRGCSLMPCKLHEKMVMLGNGTMLKIFFLPGDIIPMSLSRNEIVAFLNTIGKMSESF